MISRKVMALLATGVMAAVVVGCSGGSKDAGGSAPKGDVAKGKEVFANTCVSCHGDNAKGLPGSGKNLVTKTDWMKKQSDDQLVAFIKTGRPTTDPENTTKVDMPPKGGNPALSDDDIVNVVAYIRSLQK